MPKFQPGNQWSRNGNGSGRPAGSRNKLCKSVLEDLLADWREGGAAAIKMMRIERPAEYVRVMCSILPKELIFDQGMSDFDDDALDELLAGLHQRLLEVREQQALLTAPKEVVSN
jgi:hypothetical protein